MTTALSERPPTTCTVRFEVHVPADTPHDGAVYLSGNQDILGEWRADGLKLQRNDDGLYVAEVEFPKGSLLFYKATRGFWTTVELDAGGNDIANRTLQVDDHTTARVKVACWAKGSGRRQPASCDEHVIDLGYFGARTTGIDRPVQVHVPPDYDPAGTRTYPVLYMLDGQNVFDASIAFMGQEWEADETYDRLASDDRIYPFFIVAVHHANRREQFYTPTRRHGIADSGRLADVHALITQEVGPALRQRFRIDPDPSKTGVMGSSLAGLAAFHLGWNYPDTYGMVAAMSPSLWWGHYETYDIVFADRGPARPVKIWLDMGTMESMWAHRPVRALWHLASLLRVRGHDVKLFIDEGAQHSELSWRKRLHLPLLWFYGTGKRNITATGEDLPDTSRRRRGARKRPKGERRDKDADRRNGRGRRESE